MTYLRKYQIKIEHRRLGYNNNNNNGQENQSSLRRRARHSFFVPARFRASAAIQRRAAT